MRLPKHCDGPAIEDDWTRAWVLIELAPHLPQNSLTVARHIGRAISDDRARAFAMAILTSGAPEAPQGNVFAEALQAAWTIAYDRDRAFALSALAPHLPDRPEGVLRSFILSADRLNRPDFLHTLLILLPAIAKIEGVGGLREIQRAIREIGRWFP